MRDHLDQIPSTSFGSRELSLILAWRSSFPSMPSKAFSPEAGERSTPLLAEVYPCEDRLLIASGRERVKGFNDLRRRETPHRPLAYARCSNYSSFAPVLDLQEGPGPFPEVLHRETLEKKALCEDPQPDAPESSPLSSPSRMNGSLAFSLFPATRLTPSMQESSVGV